MNEKKAIEVTSDDLFEKGKVIIAQEEEALPMEPTVVTEEEIMSEGKGDEELLVVEQYESPKEFVSYVQKIIQKVPPFSRTNKASLERAIAFYNDILGQISRVLRSDIEGSLDMKELEQIENVRMQIEGNIEQLEKVMKQFGKKKRAEENKEGLIKEAAGEEIEVLVNGQSWLKGKAINVIEAEEGIEYIVEQEGQHYIIQTPKQVIMGEDFTQAGLEEKLMKKEAGTPKSLLVADPFIGSLSRELINYKISSGGDIEEGFNKVSEKFGLNEREKYLLIKSLANNGYPIRRPAIEELPFGPENYLA